MCTCMHGMLLRAACTRLMAPALLGCSWRPCAGLVLACLPPLLGSFFLFSRVNKGYVREGLSSSAAASVVAEESFGSIRTVRTKCANDDC